MRIATIFGLGVLGIVLAAPAQALTVSNTDEEARTITVKTGGEESDLVVEPQATVEAPCASACMLVLANGEQYEMKGNEEVAIEGGILFVDGLSGGDDDTTATGAPAEQ